MGNAKTCESPGDEHASLGHMRLPGTNVEREGVVAIQTSCYPHIDGKPDQPDTHHAGHGNVLEGGTRPSLERVVVLVKSMYNDWLQGPATSQSQMNEKEGTSLWSESSAVKNSTPTRSQNLPLEIVSCFTPVPTSRHWSRVINGWRCGTTMFRVWASGGHSEWGVRETWG